VITHYDTWKVIKQLLTICGFDADSGAKKEGCRPEFVNAHHWTMRLFAKRWNEYNSDDT
jgi:hypothetical protein